MANGRSDPRHDAGKAPPETNDPLVTALLQAQNADGGWPYQKGSSWTEPSVLALMALGPEHPACARGYAWLRRRQRTDGGWPPQAAVDETTWVTSLVALLPAPAVGARSHGQALGWILAQTAANSTFWSRLRERLVRDGAGAEDPGWPWFPGTAAWVTPTSLALLALRKIERARPSSEIRQRIDHGRRFLLARRCADGGWNHGWVRGFGDEANSYPETTGVALLALAGVADLQRSAAAGSRQWRECRSTEGAAWLKLGLLAHGHRTEGWPAQLRPRNIRDMALWRLAEQAEKGQNAFLA